MSLSQSINQLAQSVGLAIKALLEPLTLIESKIDALSGQPVDGPLDYAAYSSATILQGNTLSAGPGAYTLIAFALLSRAIPPNVPGALEYSPSIGTTIEIKSSRQLGENPSLNQLKVLVSSSGYLIFDRGNWGNLPFYWQEGDRIRIRRKQGTLEISLKPLDSFWGEIYSFAYPLDDPIFFHPSFYVEAPATEAFLSNPYGFNMTGF